MWGEKKRSMFSFISRRFYFQQRNSERAPSNIVATLHSALHDSPPLSLLFLLNEAAIKAFGAPQTVTRRHSESTTGTDCFGNTVVKLSPGLKPRNVASGQQPKQRFLVSIILYADDSLFSVDRISFPHTAWFCVRQKDKFIWNFSR